MSGLSADRLQFDVADETSGRPTKTTVAAYFKNRYNIQLRYVLVGIFNQCVHIFLVEDRTWHEDKVTRLVTIEKHRKPKS